MDQALNWIRENPGVFALAAFFLGGGTAWPLFKRLAAGTPTQIDDYIVKAVEALAGEKKEAIGALTVAEIEKRLTNAELIALVALRKKRLARLKAAGGG